MSFRHAPLGFLLAAAVGAQTPALVRVIPKPESITAGSGVFVLTAATDIWADRATLGVARQLARSLQPATGFDMPVHAGAGGSSARIVIRRDAALAKRLGPEGYRLEVRPRRITVT